MSDQFIFQIWRGQEMKGSCHSTDRAVALGSAKELAGELGEDCLILEKSPSSVWLDRLYEQDSDPLA
jgi:hypothetical protein